MSKDLYKMLGITRSADQKAIRAACRAPAKEYHPEGRDGRDPELLRTLRGT
jgi:DnaJ-class molecular chaperone